MTMNQDKLREELDDVYAELVILTNTASELKQYAAKLSKLIYEINKKVDDISSPSKKRRKNA